MALVKLLKKSMKASLKFIHSYLTEDLRFEIAYPPIKQKIAKTFVWSGKSQKLFGEKKNEIGGIKNLRKFHWKPFN